MGIKRNEVEKRKRRIVVFATKLQKMCRIFAA